MPWRKLFDGQHPGTHGREEEELMYQLVRMLPVRQLLARQMPALVISFVIAELFYKFHSFTLECGAFLATWFVVDAVLQLAAPLQTAVQAKGAK
jgi:hypothetical protein